MKEFSVVSVPANPEALVAAKSLSTKQYDELNILAKDYAIKMLTKSNGSEEIAKQIDTLETLVATLKEVANGKTHDVKAEVLTKRVVLKQAQVVVRQAETVIRSIKLKEN